MALSAWNQTATCWLRTLSDPAQDQYAHCMHIVCTIMVSYTSFSTIQNTSLTTSLLNLARFGPFWPLLAPLPFWVGFAFVSLTWQRPWFLYCAMCIPGQRRGWNAAAVEKNVARNDISHSLSSKSLPQFETNILRHLPPRQHHFLQSKSVAYVTHRETMILGLWSFLKLQKETWAMQDVASDI